MKKVQTQIHIIKICIEEGITILVYFVVYKVQTAQTQFILLWITSR